MRKLVGTSEADGLEVGVFRTFQLAGTLERLAESHPGRTIDRRGSNRRRGHVHRCLRLPGCQGYDAHADERLRLAWVDFKLLLEAKRGFG